MTETDEALYGSLLRLQVPILWLQASYIDRVTLGGWLADLTARLEYLQQVLQTLRATATTPLGMLAVPMPAATSC